MKVHPPVEPSNAVVAARVGPPLVLIAQPDIAALVAMRDACEAIPAAVLKARSPEVAIGICRLCRPDLVLIDVDTSDASGLEAVAIIRALPGCEALPIIAMTAGRRATDVRAALEAGYDDYLLKPVQSLSFIHTAIRLLETRDVPWLLERNGDEVKGAVTLGSTFFHDAIPVGKGAIVHGGDA